MFSTYILKSLKTGMYYVGSTKDVEQRLLGHNRGDVQSTKTARPWQIVHHESFTTLREARKRESQIKRWKSRAAIERLLGDFKIG